MIMRPFGFIQKYQAPEYRKFTLLTRGPDVSGANPGPDDWLVK